MAQEKPIVQTPLPPKEKKIKKQNSVLFLKIHLN
jgi:hypothetical protein